MGMITFSVKSISDVLQNSSLKIPEYQRPYKWERRHIRNLFYDIREAIDSKKSEYRIGSIILHNKKDNDFSTLTRLHFDKPPVCLTGGLLHLKGKRTFYLCYSYLIVQL
jgi:uncharacterized protein with ParB-like and HNH nuclease domain